MVNWKSRKLGDLLLLANGIALVILINIISSQYFFRMDLTEEKRYSIKEPTRELLERLDDDVFVEVYLEGELNASFRRFQKSIRETLEEFRIYSGNKVLYTFVNPEQAASEKAQNEFMAELASKGVQPTNVVDNQNGQRVEKIIFPGVTIAYGSREVGLNLLKGNKASSPEEEINQSIEGVEFELANAIYRLTNDDPKLVGLVSGHGEPDSVKTEEFRNAIREIYFVAPASLNSGVNRFSALVITKPVSSFSEVEKFYLDQFIMSGGRVLFMIDKLEATMDSTARPDYFAFPYDHNIDDLLFKYGVRINYDLVQDMNSARYPIVVGQSGNQPRIQMIDFPFFPLINRYADHPITKNLDAVVTRFVSSIDTVKAAGIRKTPLLFTSQFSRKLSAPVNVSIQNLRNDIATQKFNESFIPVAYLLEGKFSSLFKNRFLPEGVGNEGFRENGELSKLIVVADGDIAVNLIHPRTREPQPLGYDPFNNYTFANEELLMNMLAFLTDDKGLINARNKEVKIRPLDKARISGEKLKWQIINIVIPIFIVLLFGAVRSFVRKKRFANF